MKALTKRVPRQYGHIKACVVTELEKMEYRQNDAIRIKEYPLSVRKYRYCGHYREIDFFRLFDGFTKRMIHGFGGSQTNVESILTEYGMIFVEDFGENYLIEIRDDDSRDDIIRFLKKRGYDVSEVGDNRLVNVWKRFDD